MASSSKPLMNQDFPMVMVRYWYCCHLMFLRVNLLFEGNSLLIPDQHKLMLKSGEKPNVTLLGYFLNSLDSFTLHTWSTCHKEKFPCNHYRAPALSISGNIDKNIWCTHEVCKQTNSWGASAPLPDLSSCLCLSSHNNANSIMGWGTERNKKQKINSLRT